MFATSRHLLRSSAAAVVAAVLAVTGCTRGDDITGTAVPETTQASQQPSAAVPNSSAPDSTQASPESSATPATTGPATTATDLPTTVTSQTTGLTGHPPDPTDGPRTKKFGGVTTYADKSAIRIDPPRPFTPTGGAAGNHVVVTFTVVNNSPTAAPIDFWYISAEVDGQPVEPVADSAQGVGMPSGDLAPGQERSFTLAYPKSASQRLTLHVVWRDGYTFTYEV